MLRTWMSNQLAGTLSNFSLVIENVYIAILLHLPKLLLDNVIDSRFQIALVSQAGLTKLNPDISFRLEINNYKGVFFYIFLVWQWCRYQSNAGSSVQATNENHVHSTRLLSSCRTDRGSRSILGSGAGSKWPYMIFYLEILASYFSMNTIS